MGAPVEIREIDGIRKIADGLGKTVEQVEEAVRGVVYGQGLALYEMLVRNRMIPVDSGRLLASHYVTKPVKVDGSWTVEIGAGTPYAPDVHERGGNRAPDARKGYRFSGAHGAPKWLERGADLWKTSYPRRMQESMARFLKTGVMVSDMAGIVPTEPHDPGQGISPGHRRSGFSKDQALKLRALRRSRVVVWVGKGRRSGYQKSLQRAYRQAAGKRNTTRMVAIREAMEAYRNASLISPKRKDIGFAKVAAADAVLKRHGVEVKIAWKPTKKRGRHRG